MAESASPHLTQNQRETLARIRKGEDSHVHPATARVLIKRGLIEEYHERQSDGFSIKRYRPVVGADEE